MNTLLARCARPFASLSPDWAAILARVLLGSCLFARDRRLLNRLPRKNF
jgi:hypothetical protein